MSLRFGFTIGLESIRIFRDKSFMPVIRNSFFPLKKISIFEKRFLLSSLILIDGRLSVLHGFLVKIFRGCVVRLGDDHWTFYDFPRTRGRPTAMKYLWREHQGTATMKRIYSPPIQFVNASLITLLYDPLRFWKRPLSSITHKYSSCSVV